MTDEPNERAVIGGNNPPIAEVLADQHKALIARVEPIADRANALPESIRDDADLVKIGEIVLDAKALLKDLNISRETEKKPYLDGGRAVDEFFREFTSRMDRVATVLSERSGKYQAEQAEKNRREAIEKARKLEEAEAKKRQEADAAKREETAEKKHFEADAMADKAAELRQQADQSATAALNFKSDVGLKSKTSGNWKHRITDLALLDLNALKPYLKIDAIDAALGIVARTQKGAAKMQGVEFFPEHKATFRR